MWNEIKEWPGDVPSTHVRVLLAEDDPAMRELLVTCLREDGHDVVEAPDGRHLLAYIRAAIVNAECNPLPDLIISDIRMPGYSGFDVLEAVRAAKIDLPVILISGFADEKAHQEAFDLGAMLLDKPLRLEDLRQAVRALCP